MPTECEYLQTHSARFISIDKACRMLRSYFFAVFSRVMRTDAPLEKKYIQKQRKNDEKMEIRLKCVNESCFRFVLKKCVCVNSKANV